MIRNRLAANTPTTPSRWSWKAVPWQIWVVVVLLAIEGVGNLNEIPKQPQAIEWFLAKCLFVVGLVRGWKWLFIYFLAGAAIHVLYFLSRSPFVAMENLLLMGLTCRLTDSISRTASSCRPPLEAHRKDNRGHHCP